MLIQVHSPEPCSQGGLYGAHSSILFVLIFNQHLRCQYYFILFESCHLVLACWILKCVGYFSPISLHEY